MKRAVSTQSASRLTRLKLLATATAAAPVMSSSIAPRVPPLIMGSHLVDNTRMASSAPDIDALTVPELKAELRQRGMPVSGVKAALIARLEPELMAASPAATAEPEPTATAEPTATDAAEAEDGATASKAARGKPAAKTKPAAKAKPAETAPTPQKRRERTRMDAPALKGGCEIEKGGCVLDLDGADLVRGVFARRPSARNKSPYVGDVVLEDGREVYTCLTLTLTLTLIPTLTLALSSNLALTPNPTRSSCTCRRWTWAASAVRARRCACALTLTPNP